MRWFIAALFLTSGIGKIAAPDATQSYIAAMGLPLPVVSYFASMIIEIAGSLGMYLGQAFRWPPTDDRPVNAA